VTAAAQQSAAGDATVQRAARIGFALVIGGFTLAALFAFETIRSGDFSSRSVGEALEVEEELVALSGALDSTPTAMMLHLARIELLTRDDPRQRQQIVALRRAIDDRLGRAATQSIVGQMMRTQGEHLRNRTHDATAVSQHASVLVLALTLFCPFVMYLGYILLLDRRRKRRLNPGVVEPPASTPEPMAARSQSQLTALHDSGIIGMLVATLDGRIVEINDTLLRTIGYTREEILSGVVSWRSLTPPEWREPDLRAEVDLRTTGSRQLREKEYRRKDGTRIPVIVGSTLLPGPSGETISFVLDLTSNEGAAIAVKHLREARASEAMFRGLLEAAPDAVVIVGTEGKIALVNGQAERLFGYARDELIDRPIETLIPESAAAAHAAHRQHYFGNPRARALESGLELRGRRKDGSEFPVEISLSPLQSERGLLVSSAIRDISERRKTDEQRVRLAALVDSSDDAIIGKTLTGIVTSWNGGAERLFGYSAEEMVGHPITRLIPASRLDEETQVLKSLAAGHVERFDTVRVRKDGREIDVSITSSPVRDGAGKLVGASKVVRDITERRQAERALARARDAAEIANRELEAFSYSVAHDLRAPLRGMNGFAQVLLDTYKDKLDAEGRDWLEEIVLNAKKMAGLIDALLSLARVTRSELKPERVDLSRIVRDAADRLLAAETERKVELDVQEHLHADMDARLARALVDNLVENAWKFTGKVPCGHIEFGARDEDGVRTFFVRDNGAGFDMTFANNLFAPFQRLHTATEFPGTGIGLATVRRILQRHGGQVWAEGKVNEGATFYFTVPNRANGASA